MTKTIMLEMRLKEDAERAMRNSRINKHQLVSKCADDLLSHVLAAFVSCEMKSTEIQRQSHTT